MAEGLVGPDAQKMWDDVIRRVKQAGGVRLQLWEAMEHCSPITVDEQVLAVGLSTQEFHRSGQITQIETRDEIREHLRAAAGRDLDFVVFEGTTLESWNAYKQRRELAEKATALQRKQALEAAAKRRSWDELAQYLTGRWGQLKERSLPWVLAQYMLDVFPLVAELEQEALSKPVDQHPLERRHLARILSRISTHADLQLTAVALEYMRYKENKGLPSL